MVTAAMKLKDAYSLDRELNPLLRDNLEWWNEEADGRGFRREGTYVYL